MALSKTSLALDSLSVETLFTYTSVLSELTIPFLSTIDPISREFSQLGYQSQSAIYSNLFYRSSFDIYLQSINSFDSIITNQSTILAYEKDNTIVEATTNSLITITSLNNENSITLKNLESNVKSRYTVPPNRNIYTLPIDLFLKRYAPNFIFIAPSTFINTTFIKKYNAFSTLANYLYTDAPPPSLDWLTINKYVIGSGISSLYTTMSNNETNIKILYPAILSNTSTAWIASNAILQTSIDNFIEYTQTSNTYLNTIDSVILQFDTLNDTFIADLPNYTKFGSYVSSFSTSITRYLNTYIVPTNGPYISSANSSIQITNSSFNANLYNLVNSLGDTVIVKPLQTFSTFAISSLNLLSTNYSILNDSYLSPLKYIFSTNIIPNGSLVLSVSTNLIRYQTLSTTQWQTFSSLIDKLGIPMPSLSLRPIDTRISTLQARIDYLLAL